MEAPRMADLHTHNDRYGAQKNQIFQKGVLDSTLCFTGYSAMFFRPFQSFSQFSSTLHSNKREWTTGTQTDKAHRYYVQDKKKADKKDYILYDTSLLWGQR